MPTLTYSDYQSCSIKGMMWDFFFFCQVYIPTHAKEFCIKRILGRLSDGWHLHLAWLKRPPSKVFISERGLWARNGARQSPVQVSERKGKPAPPVFDSAKCSSSFIKAVGKFCHFCFIASMKWKKKIFWKAVFYLIWQIPPSSATKFPRCSLCNHMVQLLLKE